MKLLLIAVTLAGLIPVAAAQDLLDERTDFRSARIIQTVEPVFPADLVSSQRHGGRVRIAVMVDQTGRMTDYLVLSYTAKGFAEAAETALQQWAFEPAQWHGEPVGVCMTLTFNFDVKGVAIALSAIETPKSLLGFIGPRDVYRPCTPGELDRIPQALHTVTPAYPKPLADPLEPISVDVEFYIDEQGHVRMPHAVGQPPMPFAGLAVSAVAQWRFEPPTCQGRPVLVYVQQRFNFVPEPDRDSES